ncbi:unnamed protein product [Protopolystoma xenopodis]|uniref:Uncharacterized protein n=1 Tax=Protopolystoma xenopodis TaxID=117903 RepID=A0A448X574_9PLAT|nr:unnamed protein product [Protopolystoma xenopodis]
MPLRQYSSFSHQLAKEESDSSLDLGLDNSQLRSSHVSPEPWSPTAHVRRVFAVRKASEQRRQTAKVYAAVAASSSSLSAWTGLKNCRFETSRTPMLRVTCASEMIMPSRHKAATIRDLRYSLAGLRSLAIRHQTPLTHFHWARPPKSLEAILSDITKPTLAPLPRVIRCYLDRTGAEAPSYQLGKGVHEEPISAYERTCIWLSRSSSM